jgi:RecB family exonuclease
MTTDYLAATQTSVAESRRTRLFDLIDRLETLETPGEAPGYGHCAGVLREQLGRRSAGLRSLGSGVYVGPIWTTAGCPFDTVFVLGMTEARYPGKGFSDPLLPDPVKREIDATGEYLGTVERTIEQSRLSFLSVLSSADSVFLYWPSGVPGAAREFGPARWFLDAARVVSGEPLLQAGQLMTGPVTGVSVRNRRDVLNLPATDAGEEQEYDVLSARNWSRAENDPAAFPLSEVAPSIAGSVRFEAGQTGAAWSEYDGKINLPEVDPRSHETTGSATAFETYAACPYRYFLSRRLHVEPTESPEPELALDALTFGTLIHDVLEKFALWRMEFDAETKPGRADQESWMRTEISKHIAVLKDETPGRSMGAWQIEESRAWLILRQWLRREPTTAGQPDMRQVEAEYSFGRGGAGTSDERPKKSGPPVEVQTATGKIVKFRGQVDRVDISEDGSRVVVYDYKSGSTAAYSKLDTDPTRHGTKLQLPLYSLAVAHKYPDADVTASYWFVREAGSNELKPGPGKYRKDLAGPALAAAVETIVDGIDHGVFPARPGGPATWGDGGPSFENCLFCEYVRVCPKSKARDWIAKRGSDPALNDYLELAEDGQ